MSTAQSRRSTRSNDFWTATRDVLRAWIEKDIYVWRMQAMLGYPPTWRLKMLAGPGSAAGVPFFP